MKSTGVGSTRGALLVAIVGLASAAFAGLEVTKSIQNGLTTVPSGQTFTYKLQYRAASTTTDFYGATLTDVLPPGIEYQSLVGTVHVASFAYTAATRTLTVVFVDPLPAGSTGEILVNTRFTPGSTLPGTVATNTATLAATNAPSAVAPPVTIVATASNRATAAKSLVGSSVPLDQNVTYTVSANNSQTVGALNATDLTLLDYLPEGAVFVAASGGGVYDPGTHTVTWTSAALAAGSTFSRTLTVVYPSASFALGASATNDLSVTLTPLGGDPTNLTARAVNTIVAPVASSTFTKDVSASYVYDGKAATKSWTFDLRNTGNVPLYDVVVTDAVPAQVQVTSISSGLPSGTPAGLNDPIGVYYKTTLNGTWTATPGSPYPGTVLVTEQVSTLGLAPGELITDLKWDFGTLPVGYRINNLQFGSTILTTDRDGQPVVAGQTITNNGVLAYTDFTGPKTKTDPATIPVKTPRPVAELAKSASPSTVNDGGLATFTVRLTNRSEAAQPLLDPVLADLLDAKLVYEPGSWTVVSKPSGAPNPLFETIPNYAGSRTLLRWSWEDAASYSLPTNSYVEMRFQARVPAGTIYGGINNDLTLAKWDNTDLDTSGATGTTDALDLDGDGNLTETVYYRRSTLTVTARASMDSVKWVKGELDADWSKYPDSGLTVPGGRADYRLIVTNTGNVPISNAVVLDILPTLGDTGVIDLSPRDTEWNTALAGPAVTAPPGVTVYYSREQDPTRLDFEPSGPPGSEPAYWSTNAPATMIEARSLKFDFNGIVIQPGASYELTWPMRVPVATPTDGRIAWNSFGYYGTRTDSNTQLLPSEPIKVGIAVQPDLNAVYGDRVWYDANTNGLQDVGETGVNGIRVRLYEDSGAGGFPDGVINTNVDRYVGFTMTADDFNGESGYYLFPNLDRGHYYAVFEIPSGYEVSPMDVGADGAVDSDVDALTGYTPITWLDDDEEDLTWDLGIFILPPVGISIVKTAGTAPDGDVHWILPGTPVTYSYRVTNTGELAIVRMTVTDDKLGLVGMIDGPLAPGASTTLTKTSSALSAGVTNVGSVVGHPANPAGQEIPGAPPVNDDDDAIVHVYASIGDFVWYDVDRDGIQDAGEAAVGGVQVVLYDGAGAPIATNTTAANGRYRFSGLLPGDYSVGFTAPAGYLISPNDQGADDAKDSDADPLTGRTVTTTLVAGEYDSTWDLGLWNLASIGDTVWYDVDRDGIQDAGETGVEGATVTLYDGGGAVVAVTNTSATGFYTFTSLLPGDYSLEFTPPAGYVFSAADQGGDNAKDSDANPVTGRTVSTTLSVGENDMTWDAGLWRPASIGDYVWNDADADGLQDGGETGLGGVLVTLYDDLGQAVATTTTDAVGRYDFTRLVPGDYSVGFTLPSDSLFSPRDAGGDDAVDSDPDPATGRTIATTLAPGENDLTWDAGIYLIRASIGDRVWHDTNANGIQDLGETGVPNVVVTLFDAVGTAISSTNTDATGFYTFENLVPADYSVGFEAPVGYRISPRDQGADASDSDADPATGRTVATTLAPDEDDMTWDLGIYRPASLGDTVWDDADGDGVQDAGEIGVANVTVTLYGAGGAAITTATTDADGKYLFPDLVPGTYSVGFSLPAGYAFTLRDQGGDGADSDADTTTGRAIATTLESGENDLTWDAGIYRPVYLGDRVWLDVNRNGVQEAGEVGFAGIAVTLYDVGGVAISNTVTDASGGYLFAGLPPGTYHVGFTIPVGYAWTVPNQGDDALDSDADLVTGLTATTTLRSGQSDLTLDAGLYRLIADLELTKSATRDCFPSQWTIPISKGEQFVTGDYWLRIENNQPSFDVWGPGSMMAGVDISRTWHHVAGRFTRGPAAWGPHKMEILVDGTVVATTSQWGTTDTSTASLFLGSYLGTQYFYAGAMDEVRLSGTARSGAWLRTSVAQQNAPSTFLVAGAEAAGTVYGYEKTLTVQGSAVAGDLTDFPVLVSVVDADLATHVETAEGWDIGFTLSDGTPLAHEVEKYYASSGTLVAWVKLPVLPAGVDTTILMHYGDATVVAATETPEAVWDDDFRMVQHFEETSGPLLDSTANGNDGVVSGAWSTAAGSADGAYLFDGIDDKVEIPNSPSVQFVDTDFTIEGWYARELPHKEFVVTVTNRGPDQATNVTVADPLGSTMGYVTSDASRGAYDPATGIWTVGTMDSNDVARLVLVVDPLTASITNRAEVATSDAADPDSTPDNDVVGEDDQADATPMGCAGAEPPLPPPTATPAIQVVKVAGTAIDGTVLTIASGSDVTYTYTVHNIGNVTLTAITVTDDKLGAVGVVPSLLIGQSATLTAVAHNVTAGVTNIATAVATHGATTVSDTDDAIAVLATTGVPPTPPATPAIQVFAVAGAALDGTVLTIASGSDVTYTYTVHNIGNVTLTDIAVTDDKLGAVGVVPSLLIGQSATLTAVAHNVTASVTNVATAVGDYGVLQATDADDAVVLLAVSDIGPNPWDRADFAVTHQEFIGPSPTVEGEVFAVRVTVMNRGLIAGDGGDLGVFVTHFDPVAVGEAADATVDVGELQPGQSRTLEVGGLVAPATRGPNLLRSYVDIGGVTAEWSEGDNQLTLLYQISPVVLLVQPVAGSNAISLTWNSFWGDRYIVYRADSLAAPFVPLVTGIEAVPPTNEYIDLNPPAGGAFYKVGVQPWGVGP